MKNLEQAQRGAYSAAVTFSERAREYAEQRERGDVPGWVMITVMTAGIVVVLAALAQTLLQEVFTNAINSVTG